MSRALRTSTGCLLILFLLALGACSDLTAAPSPTSARPTLPTPAIAPTPTPTRRAPAPTLPPTAVAGPFSENAFPVKRIDESLTQAGIDFDPGFSPPSSGTYLFYITALKPDDLESWDSGTSPIELRYVSLDATSRGRILSVQAQPDLLMMTNDLQAPGLLMAWFNERGATIREVDLIDRTLRVWQAAGLSELYPNQHFGFYKVEISTEPRRVFAHYAFSPDGRWLVWDCDVAGAGWCLFDAQAGAVLSAEPCGEVMPRRTAGGESEFNWAPDSSRLLARRACDPETKYTLFIASPGGGTVERFAWPAEYRAISSEQDFGSHSPADYLWSPEGQRLFTLREGDLQTGEGGAIYVVSADCIFGGPCDPATLIRWPYDAGGLFSATFYWSPAVEAIGFAEQPLAVDGLGYGSRTTVGLLDLESGNTRIITEFAPAASELQGWSPDGDWVVMVCPGGKDAPYALCGLSMDGLLRGLVPASGPETGFGFIGFAGWWVIP